MYLVEDYQDLEVYPLAVYGLTRTSGIYFTITLGPFGFTLIIMEKMNE